MIKKLVLFFILVSLFCLNAQNYFEDTYIFRIPNKENRPNIKVVDDRLVITFENKKLQALFDDYQIKSFRKLYPNSKRTLLQSIYEIEVENEDLINIIRSKFPNVFFDVNKKIDDMLFIPNDLGVNGGASFDQEELNYIRGPEAWNLSKGGGSDYQVPLGISETINLTHPDLLGKSESVQNNNSTYNGHGTIVALYAAGSTHNGIGGASIGFNSYIKSSNKNVALLSSHQTKVVNMSWGLCNPSQYYINMIQEDIDEALEINENLVLVAAAGNGLVSCSGGEDIDHYPASFKNVISVTACGHKYDTYDSNPNHTNRKDVFEITDSPYLTLTYNDSIDIVAPGRQVTNQKQGASNGVYSVDGGTSFAAPIVTGTIGLMFYVNYCLDPKEVETILKLTAVKIDTLPQNLPYYGKLGAGRLDTYEAVKMSKDMADPFGTVEVKNRILYRPWFYKLTTAPYEIKLSNNDVSGGSKLKFRARNNIEITSGTYMPDTGYIDLQIDENLDLNGCPPPVTMAASQSSNENVNSKPVEKEELYVVFPTLVKDQFTIKPKHIVDQSVDIKVFDFFGTEIFSKAKVFVNEDYIVPFERFRSGIYVLKIYDNGDEIHTEKLVKK